MGQMDMKSKSYFYGVLNVKFLLTPGTLNVTYVVIILIIKSI
jgi:hypothetical protein